MPSSFATAPATSAIPITNASTTARNKWRELDYAGLAAAVNRSVALQPTLFSNLITDEAVLAKLRDLSRKVIVIDCLREVRPPFSPEAVCQEFALLCKSYSISSVYGDRYAGAWPVEQFSRFGLRYEQSAKPKSDLYIDLLPLINSRRIELLDCNAGRLRRVLHALQSMQMPRIEGIAQESDTRQSRHELV